MRGWRFKVASLCSRPALLLTLLTALVLSGPRAPSSLAAPQKAAEQGVNVYGNQVRLYLFSGYVYQGEVGEPGAPLGDVTVSLYCSDSPDDPGALVESATTDPEGWYELPANEGCFFYHILKTDLPGHAAGGAISEGGEVVAGNWIRYASPLEDKPLDGNLFWDRPPIWEFAGRVVDQEGAPVPGMELRLLGSTAPGRAGQMLDWATADQEGAYRMRYEWTGGGPVGFPHFQVALLRPGRELVESLSESGGHPTEEGWLEFSEVPPAGYAGNVFVIEWALEDARPPPIALCAIADAWVGQDEPATNHGADSLLRTGYYTRQVSAAYRTLARFDPSWVPAGTVVTSAEFQAYQLYAGGRDPVDASVYTVQNTWQEGTVTWNNRPGVGPLAATGSLGAGQGYQSWEITGLATGWLKGTLANNGVELRGPEQAPEWLRTFESRENAHPPRLVLHPSGSTAAPVPGPHKPYLVLTPDRGKAGQSFWARGYNLGASKTYHLYWDLPLSANQLATVQTGSLGTLGAQVTPPANAEAGIHQVLLYQVDPIEQTQRLLAQAPYIVEPVCWATKPPLDLDPTIEVSPAQGPSNGGNVVQVVGSGWSPKAQVKLSWDDPALCATTPGYCLGQVTTNAQGKFLASFAVPAGVAGDDHLVVARRHPAAVPVERAVAEYRTVQPPSPPAGDTRAPSVFASHTIDSAYPGGPPVSLFFQADAWDPLTTPTAYNGIVRVELWAWPVGGTYAPVHKVCQVNGWTPSLSCLHVASGPWSSSTLGFYYFAQAEDRSGNVTSSPGKFAWLIDGGPDADNDGLSDAVEQVICTHPQNPDTDRDNLLDGWEVYGYRFAGGDLVDLPSMGAHPCIPDVFVEVDWVAGDAPNPQQHLQPTVNAYKEHGMRLHIDWGQWGGGEQIASEQNAIKVHFDPHRLWSFHYVVFRPGSSYCWRGKASYVGQGNRAQTFMHELGHCIGLGHGGSSGPGTQTRSGTAAQQKQWGFQWVWYDQDSVDRNNKPNYLSTMSYAWGNGSAWVPGAGALVPYNYSEEALPPLDESKLDERATSPFVKALRAYPLPPGAPASAVPITGYSCLDPDDGQIYIMVTDGHQLLARLQKDGPGWQYTGLPAQDKAGIDWNCDGTISDKPIAANVNGCSKECHLHSAQAGWKPGQTVTRWTPGETLLGHDDWARIPGIDPCIGDVAGLGKTYLQAAHDPPCESNGWAPGSSLASPTVPPLDYPPLGERCNGEDDDEDGRVDEGCIDRDEDGIVDDLDNCPLAPNPDQADGDRDLQGDACSLPPEPAAGLRASRVNGQVWLTWDADPAPDVIGYNVYRQSQEEGVFSFAGEAWPATEGTEFLDERAPGGYAAYHVRAVNRHGLESDPSETIVLAPLPGQLYLPYVLNQYP